MATMRTISSAAKLFNLRNALLTVGPKLSPAYLEQAAIQSNVPVRLASYGRGPKMDQREVRTLVEVVKDPEAWATVERLIAQTTIPAPKPKAEYPSGWKPPNPKKDLPYFVQRTANHMHSVHMSFSRRKTRKITTIRRIHGDIWALERDLTAYLKKLENNPYITSAVNEAFGKIYYRGDRENNIKQWFDKQGF